MQYITVGHVIIEHQGNNDNSLLYHTTLMLILLYQYSLSYFIPCMFMTPNIQNVLILNTEYIVLILPLCISLGTPA